MPKLFAALLLISNLALCDTPPARGVNSQTYDAAANPIGSALGTGGARGLNTHSINSTSDPALESIIYGGSVIDPRNIRALTSSDAVSCVQSGTWSAGRTWSLLNTTDSVNSVQSGTWTVQQGSTPTGVANAWPTKVTDGTNVAAVKPATTAPTVADPSLVVAISPNSPISVTSVPPAATHVTGSLTAACPTGTSCPAGSTIQVSTDGFTTLGFETHGTWSASITQDVSFDPLCSVTPNSVDWFQTASVDTDTNESTYLTTWGSSKNGDPWVMNVASAQCARLRAVSFTSGPVDVTMDTGVGTAMVWAVDVGNVASGSTDTGNPVKVGGKYNLSFPTLSDGQRGDIQIDSSARLITAPLTNSSVVKSQLQDNAGTGLTSTLISAKQALDVNAVGLTATEVSDQTISGSITTTCATPSAACPAGSDVILLINGVASAQVQISGTFSGASLNVDGSTDGVNWFSLLTASGPAGQYSNASFSAAGKYRVFRIAGLQQLRVRASALTSGSVDAHIVASIGSNLSEVVQLTPSNLLSNSWLNDGAGNTITSQVSGSQRALDMGINVAGVQVDPRTRTWSLLNTTDSVNAVQSGTWTTGRTWSLLNTTDSVNAVQSGIWNINNVSGTVSLPTNAAQETGGNLAGLNAKFGSLGQKTMTGSAPVVLASDQSAIPASQSGTWNISNVSGTVSLPTNAAQETGGNLASITTNTSNISGKLGSLGQKVMTGSAPVVLASDQTAIPASQSGTWNINNVSGTVSLPTNAAQETGGNLAGLNAKFGSLGQKTMAGSAPVVLASDQAAIPVTQSGTWTTGRTWSLLNTADSVNAVQSGTWTVQQGSAPWSIVGNIASGVSDTGNPVKVGGVVNTSPQAYSNGQRADFRMDADGDQYVNIHDALPSGTNSIGTVKAQLQDNAGTAITVGQKTMTSSVPVVVSSDQSTLNIQGTGTSGTPAGNVLTIQGTGSAGMAPVIVGGGAAVGASPTSNPVSISGVDGGGLKRIPLMDTAGRQQILLNDSAGTGVTVGQKTMSASLPVTMASDQPLSSDVSATGNITSTQNVQLTTRGTHGIAILVTGTWTGTLSFEESVDGSTWIAAEAYAPASTGSENTVSSTTGNGTWIFTSTAGMSSVRVRGNTVATGTAAVTILGNQSNFNTPTYARENGTTIPTYGAQIGVSDGTNLRFAAGDTSGRVTTSNNASFNNISTATTTTVKSGAGVLFAICWNKMVNNATTTIYDNTAGSGTTIGTVTELQGGGSTFPNGCMNYGGVNFSTGLTIVTSGASNLTVIYK